jgi:hypothetical protein
VPAAERAARGVPKTLLSLDQIAEAVLRLSTDEKLAGRLLLMRNDEQPALIAATDPGFASLEAVSL